MKDYLEFYQDSYDRVVAQGDGLVFFDTFYEIFLSRSEEIAGLFRNTDMERQRSMLRESFRYMVDFSITRGAGEDLRRIARRHSKYDRNIRPELYDAWLESLMEAVTLCDPCYSEEVELAWRVVLAPGIAYMKFRYDH